MKTKKINKIKNDKTTDSIGNKKQHLMLKSIHMKYNVVEELHIYVHMKEGAMIKVPREPRKPFSFKNKDNELMEDYIDVGIGNYVILDQVKDNENQEYLYEGY
jgi:hypothetical protein